MDGLFREEAVRARENLQGSSVVLVRPRAFVWSLWAMATLVAAALGFLLLADYARKERVRGTVEPAKGLIRVHAPDSGVVEHLAVAEGELVEQGQPLLLLRSDTFVPAVGGPGQSVAAELEAVQGHLAEQVENEDRRYRLQVTSLRERIGTARSQMAAIRRQHEMVERRMALSRDLADRLHTLARDGYASQLEIRRQEDAALSLAQQAQALQEREAQLREQGVVLQHELAQLPVDHDDSMVRLLSEQSEIANQLLRARAEDAIEVRAPISGRVSGLVTAEGKRMAAAQVAMSIVPEDSELRAVLYLPSRAVGFVATGQGVSIRLDAFPHQRFGTQPATVVEVGETLIRPDDPPDAPGAVAGDRYYRVLADLDANAVQGYGRSFPLRAGMEFEADIVTERRSLLRWLFDPLYSVQGRL